MNPAKVNVTRPARTQREQYREQTAQHVYDMIDDYYRRHGISPTTRQLAAACGFSRAGLDRYLDLLEARGYIERDFNTPRSIRPRWSSPIAPDEHQTSHQEAS